MPARPTGKVEGATQRGAVVKYDPARGYGLFRPDGPTGQALFVRFDKLRPESGLGRVPEAVLLALAAVGGSGGALLGMHVPTRHTTAKTSFQAVYWLIVALQAGAAIFLLTRP